MNERPFVYWRTLFEARGFRVCRFDKDVRNVHGFERAPR